VVAEAVQNYVTMMSGLSKMTRKRAVATARSLLSSAGLDEVAADAQERVSKLADEILQAGKANRELLEKLVTTEIEKAASRLGFVRAEEVDDLRDAVAGLRREIAELRLAVAYEGAGTPAQSASPSAAKAPRKAAPKRASARTTTAKTGPPKPDAPTTSPSAASSPAAKSAAKNTAAKRGAAQRTGSGTSAGGADSSGQQPGDGTS
jgi:polyhydroxyalkanoate synthesis regulator phasin